MSTSTTPVGERSVFDVIVIGGGVEGGAIAYQCALRGMHVLVLEARETASQASGASAGGVRQQGRDARELAIAMRAIAMWPGLSDELGADLEYYQQGHLTLVTNESDMAALADSVADQRARGLDVRMLHRDELKGVAAGVSDEMLAGSYCPTDGHANPIATTKAFLAAAERLGAEVHQWEPVIRILVDESQVSGVETARRHYFAPQVILAAGAWSVRLAGAVGIGLPIEGNGLQMMLTTPLEHELDPVLGCIGRPLSLKQLRTGQYLIGGGWAASAYVDVERPIGRNRPDSIEGSAKAATSVWPILRETQLMRVWAGLEAITSDQVPILGESGIPGLLLATGFSGHGFALAPYIGVILADIAAGNGSPLSLDGLTIDRFSTPK